MLLRRAIGTLLLVAGVGLIGFSALLDLSSSRGGRWWQRASFLAPAGVAVILLGGALLAG